MIQRGGLLFLSAETHLHPGSGQGVGAIDRPIQRDRVTGLPIIYFSGLKGALRDHLQPRVDGAGVAGSVQDDDGEEVEGSAPETGADELSAVDVILGTTQFAGALLPSDARLLLMPVASLHGLFAWVTCPYALALLHRDGVIAGTWSDGSSPIPVARFDPRGEEAIVASYEAPPVIRGEGDGGHTVVLDGFVFQAREMESLRNLAAWIRETALPRRQDDYIADRIAPADHGEGGGHSSIVVVDDDAFRDFCRSATVLQERNTLGDRGVSESLWTDEHLPQYSILYSMLGFTRARTRDGLPQGLDGLEAEDLLRWMATSLEGRPLFQVGGDATLGRGFVSAVLVRGHRTALVSDDREGSTEDGAPRSPVPSSPSPPSGSGASGTPSIYRRRAQAHAQFAYEQVEKLKKEEEREYRTVVRGAPSLLRRAGLETSVAFWLAKGGSGTAEGETGRGYQLLYKHLEQGLLGDAAPGGRLRWPVPDEDPREDRALFQAVRGADSSWLREAERRAEEVLGWLKRVTEAMGGGVEEGREEEGT